MCIRDSLKNHKEEPDILVQLQRKVATVAADSVDVFHHHHHDHHVRVAGEGRCVVAPTCPPSTARLQGSPIGRVESFRSWSSHLFRGRLGPGPSSSRATCPNTEMRRRDRRWDSEVRPVRCSSSSFQTRLYHRIPSSCLRPSGGKHPESSHQLIVRSRHSNTDKTNSSNIGTINIATSTPVLKCLVSLLALSFITTTQLHKVVYSVLLAVISTDAL